MFIKYKINNILDNTRKDYIIKQSKKLFDK